MIPREIASHFTGRWLRGLLCPVGIALVCLLAATAEARTLVAKPDGTSDVAISQADNAGTTIRSFVGETPEILSVSPSSARPGAIVTITGRHFLGALGVGFGSPVWGASEITFVVDSDEQIRAVVSGMTGPIYVTNPAGTGVSGFSFWIRTSYTVRPDGSGDAPTFQAGIDSIAARQSEWPAADTLIVEPGTYDEDVSAVGVAVHWVVECPGGREQTRLRSLRVAGRHSIRVEGLTISGRTTVEAIPPRFVGCRFDGPVSVRTDRHGWLTRCIFRDRTDLHMSGTVDSSRFEGIARIRPNDDPITLSRCVLAGPDTAAYAGGGPYAVRFDFCTFSGMSRAIVLAPFDKALVEGCLFSDVRGPAISYDGPLGDYGQHRLEVVNTRFERCGGAVSVQAGAAAFISRRLWLTISGSTVVDSRGTGVDLAGLVVPEVMGCIVTGSAADGMRIELVQGAYGDPSAVVSGNTFALNVGAGLHVLGEQPGDEFSNPVTVERNILAGNRGAGIHVEAPARVIGRHNDAWMNPGSDYIGLTEAEDDLTLDPQFCNAPARDFHVASSSPCAPSGPYGQIGALDVGCEAMTVPLDVENHPINLRSNAPVEAAILAHRLFDSRRVDPETVRLGGAVPSSRGNVKPAAQVRDVNQDGLADLLLTFNARDMAVEEGEAALEGRTFDGPPFRGSDVVEIRGSALRAEMEGAPEAPTRLALSLARAHGELALLLDLPSSEPATIEIFDVAGRRVLSRDLAGLGAGHHRLQLWERLASGLYLLRLRQGTQAVARGTVVLQ